MIFKNETLIVDKYEKIEVDMTLKSYANYYGDYSTLNDMIDNYEAVVDIKDSYFSNLVFVDGKLYYVDDKGRLNGKIKVIDKNKLKFAKISYYDGIFYLITGSNIVVAFDKEGYIVWQKELNVIPYSSPVIY
ncbi:MAG: hypothetical protein LBC92_02090, partial [Rickettsiales bacterium]|nr:hypothetical protein [Rickettsiales bacterium]